MFDMSDVCRRHFEEYKYFAAEESGCESSEIDRWFSQNCSKCIFFENRMCMRDVLDDVEARR